MIYFSVCFPKYLKFVYFHIGEQNLVFGFKLKANGLIIVTERQLETIPCGIRSSIEIEMVEGDFKIFKGTG